MAWDSKCYMLIRKGKNKTLYITVIMLKHHGFALIKTFKERIIRLTK